MMKYFINIMYLLLLFCNMHAQSNSEAQPFIFQTRRLIETLDYCGNSIAVADKTSIENIITNNDEETATKNIGAIQDKYALFSIIVNSESRVNVIAGMAKPTLQQNGWNTFLIQIENQSCITAVLKVLSEQAKRDYDGGEAIYGFGKKRRKQNCNKE